MLTKQLKNIPGEYEPIRVNSVFPKNRLEVFNSNGWGFRDSKFACENGKLTFTGNR